MPGTYLVVYECLIHVLLVDHLHSIFCISCLIPNHEQPRPPVTLSSLLECNGRRAEAQPSLGDYSAASREIDTSQKCEGGYDFSIFQHKQASDILTSVCLGKGGEQEE